MCVCVCVQVEATKFTEVGYHGRDVDSIIRDLVEVAQTTVKQRCKRAAAKKARHGDLALPAVAVPTSNLPLQRPAVDGS